MNNQQEKTLLPSKTRLQLKKLAHHLKPVIHLGKKGITEALLKEIDNALLAHELIKVQVLPQNKENLDEDLAVIIAKTAAFHIDTVGNIVILFRKRDIDSAY